MAIGSATLDRALTKIGSWVMINIGSEILDTRGDGSYFYTQFSGIGYIQVFTDTEVMVEPGIMNQGDATGYFQMAANFPTGSHMYLSHQGINYEILGDAIIPHMSGNQLLKTVNLRRIIPQLDY